MVYLESKIKVMIIVIIVIDQLSNTTLYAVADMKPFEDALRMIRHSKWWEDHTSHLKR